MAAHPQLRVDLLLLDRVIDLIEEGVDVGVRLAHLPDSRWSRCRSARRGVVLGAATLLRRHRVSDVVGFAVRRA